MSMQRAKTLGNISYLERTIRDRGTHTQVRGEDEEDISDRLFSEHFDSIIDQKSSFMRNSGTSTTQFKMVKRHMNRIQKHMEK